jgi:ABC-type phosphate transport system substrate-binding protein
MTRSLKTIAAAAVLALALAGCGLGGSTNKTALSKAPNTPQNAKQTYAAVQNGILAAQKKRFKKLPKPPANTVSIASGSSLNITPDVIDAYERSSPGVTVNDSQTSPSEAFDQLCSGKVDIAETTRPPSAEELDQCTQNGITFKTDSSGNPLPIELAADGIVVATKNDSDVGGDCLKLSTVRAIFKPGSTYDNWSQVGFDDLPLHTAGRLPSTPEFQEFATLVLGTEGNANLGDVRADYRPQNADSGTREQVTNDNVIAALEKRIKATVNLRIRNDHSQIVVSVNNAVNAANAAVLRKIAAANAALAKTKKVLTPAEKRAIVTSNADLDASVKAAAAQTAKANVVARITREVDAEFAPQLASVQRTGVLGVFRFSYYELYEDKLRPMEIWDPTTTQTQLSQENVATTETTKAEEIASHLREQAGGGVANTTTISFPATPTTPGSSFPAAGGGSVTVPRGGAVNVQNTPNCIFPSTTTITSGVYPLSVRLLAYVPENRLSRAAVIKFLSYYLIQGENTVADQRLIPIGDAQRASEYKEITGHSVSEATLLQGQNPAGPLAPVSTAEGSVNSAVEGGQTTGTSTAVTTAPTTTGTSTTSTAITQAGTSGSTPGVG